MRRLVLATTLVGCHVHPTASPVAAPGRVSDLDAPAPVLDGRPLDGVEALAIGSGHGCALREDATVWCWGGNGFGQLAWAHAERSPVARPIEGLPPATAVFAGDDRSCIIDGEGAVWCWGANFRGQVDADRTLTPVPSWVTVASCGVGGKDDGDTHNLRFAPQRVVGVAGATSLALGLDHTCAATADGVECWGSAQYGAVGEQHEASFMRVRVPMPGPVRAIVAGNTHTCAVDGEGDTWCWGDEQIGDSGVQPPHRVVEAPKGRALAVLAYQTCLRAEDESVWCWGGDPPEPPEPGEEPEEVRDPWELHRPTPERVALPVPWERFIHTNGFSCAIGRAGAVSCNDEFFGPRPVAVEGIGAPVVALAGAGSVCSLSAQGRVHCFSAYRDRVMVVDWAGTDGYAMPVMIELDAQAPLRLPPDAVVHPQARPPAEARVCHSTTGSCTHRLGGIECECDDQTRRAKIDPAGVAWYDDEGCFRELAAVCGAGPSEAVGVSCRSERGQCEVRGGPQGVVSCGCADGDGMAGSGEEAWSGLEDAALVEVCRGEIVAQCG